MSIESITTPTTVSPTPTSAPGMKGTKDEFLRLFMAQLQHQDPFAPTSGADMVAQLAQLSAVEQAKVTNDQLAELAAQQASSASASLSTLVGRTCNANAESFQLDHVGAVPPIEVSATGPMKGASVVITNADGKELRRIQIPDGASTSTLVWDGKDASGNPVAPGSYKISVDSGSTASTITSRWQGRIDAVELTPDGPRLRIGGVLIAPGDIRTIGALPAPAGNPAASGKEGIQ
jgi:flagellar basal-body rod modification protein FlgD